MPELKTKPTWAYIEPTVREAMDNYVADHKVTISELVRSCIMRFLLDEGYLTSEQLEMITI